MRWFGLLACTSVLVSGCVSIPEFDQASGVRPNTIVNVIQCELYRAKEEYADKMARWVASADLVLQVDEQTILAPSFTHTGIATKPLTSVLDWGLKLDSQAQRVYNESVTFTISKLTNVDCGSTGRSLNGNLGLKEVIAMAFDSIDPHDAGVGLTGAAETTPPHHSFQMQRKLRGKFDEYKSTSGGLAKVMAPAAGGGGAEKSKGAFGTSIQFVLVRNVNSTGPTWTLQNFKGPGKLLTLQRTDTHKLTISFAKSAGNNFADLNAAKEAARQNNLLLYQQTLPSTIINQLKQ